MTKDQITALAREHGTSYTNRHFVGESAFAFGNEAWAAFCEALASPQPVQQSVQPVAVISGAFGGRPCIRVLDTAAIYPDGTALYTSPPIAQPVQPRDVDWQSVSKLIEANDQAKSLGFMPGTSNWGAMLWKAIAQPVQPTEPIGCVGKDGCTILYFTSELLPFETDLYIYPPA